jgi:dihydroxyacetone kinase
MMNASSDFVRDAIVGLTSTSSGLARIEGWNIVVDTERNPNHVAVIAGGGAGHEPAHGGYVGDGMLGAAVVGEVYTSPSVDAVLTAIRAVAGPAGVLLIIKNYTGDRLNFGLAAEIARGEGVNVEIVVVADDVALPRGGKVGARGLAGVVFVHKVAGAAASRGRPLDVVTRWAKLTAESVATMGVALSAGTVPAAGVPNFDLGEDEIEWGLGIHGEPGLERSALLSANDIAKRLTHQVVTEGKVRAGEKVALLINGLGATPPCELDIVAGEIVKAVTERGIDIERVWTGNFLTALDTHGCSVSVLKLSDGMTELLDAITHAPAWPGSSVRNVPSKIAVVPRPDDPADLRDEQFHAMSTTDSLLFLSLKAAAQAMLDAEVPLTELDRIVGDGDLGTSLARGARSIFAQLSHVESPFSVSKLLRDIGAKIRETVGGTSGPLYSIMFLRAASYLDGRDTLTAIDWAQAFSAAVDGVQTVGGAVPGDCTMLDALLPASIKLARELEQNAEPLEAFTNALNVAKEGTAATVDIRASLGRSSYIGERAVGHVDPGAYAVTLWMEAVHDVLQTAATTGPSASNERRLNP